MRIIPVILFSIAAFAADKDFNGRWDISANTKPRPRAWWMELKDVGTPNPSGKFVSAYAGDMNNIDSISVDKGELKLIFKRPNRGKKPGALPDMIYTAHLVKGKLVGSFMIDGQKTPPIEWTGVRAPVIKDKDDRSWKEGTPIQLFNGKDLSGWKGLVPEAEVKWTVSDGILRNAPPTTDIVSEQSFWNFKLHTDFRIVEKSNSGIGLRGR